MIRPLVQYTQRADIVCAQYGIFRQDRPAQSGDHAGNPVIDLRVDMIGPARKHDAFLFVLAQPGKRAGAFVPHILSVAIHLFPGGIDRIVQMLAVGDPVT